MTSGRNSISWLQGLLAGLRHGGGGTVQTEPVAPFEYWKEDTFSRTGKRLHRPLVYMFEHVALPRAFFENHPEMMSSLAMPELGGLGFLMHFWSKATVECEGRFWPAGMAYQPAFSKYRTSLESKVSAQLYKRNGMDIWLVSLPAPITQGEAFIVGMCRRSDGEHQYMHRSADARYFTLERGATDEGPVHFCEWTPAGEHRNYGQFPRFGAQKFLEMIEGRL